MTETAEQQLASTIQYPVVLDAIKALATEYMPLKINGILDKEGQMIVRTARLDVRKHRVAVEHKRKALKADALKYGRTVDSAAKMLTEPLVAIEDHLIAEEKTVKDEIARITKKDEERKQAVLRNRLDRLTSVGCMLNPADVEAMNDDTYDEMLVIAIKVHETKKAEKEAERKRLAAEEAERKREAKEANEKRKIEEDRLATERKKLDEDRAELEAEKQRMEAVRLEAERKAAEEKQRKEENQFEIERQEAEEKRQEETVKAKQEEQLRREAMRPDLEKLAGVADTLGALAIRVPGVSARAEPRRERVISVLRMAAAQIRQIAAE